MTAISVVIPTFNRPSLAPLAIKSVLAQTHPAAEIIVVDDGSQQDMREVLGEFGRKIQVIRQVNTGLSGARNTGIRAAQHEWVAFLDDDDEYGPERLARAAASIKRAPAVQVHATNTAIVSETGPELDLFELRGMPAADWMSVDRPLPWVLKGCFFAQSLVARRHTLEEIGLFRPTFYEDMDLFVCLVPRSPWIIDGQPALRLIRRDNTFAMSADWRSKPLERCGALVRIHREALALPGLTANEIASVRNGLASYLFERGSALSRTGDRNAARDHFAESAAHFQSRRSRLKAHAARWCGKPVVGLLDLLASRRRGFIR